GAASGVDGMVAKRFSVQRKTFGIGDCAGGRAGSVGKVDKKVFRLGAPIAAERDLDAGADGPAGLNRAADWAVGKVRPDIAEGGAGGGEHEVPIKRIADAAARGAEPGVSGQAACGAEAGGGEGAMAAGGPYAQAGARTAGVADDEAGVLYRPGRREAAGGHP